MALLLFWGGYKIHSRLKWEAEVLNTPLSQPIVRRGELKEGLRNGLKESGSSPDEASAIVRAIKKVGGVRTARKGDSYEIVRDDDGTFRHLTLTRGKKRIFVRPDEDGFEATVSDAPLHEVVLSAVGEIEGSLWLSMRAQDVPHEVIQEYADAFQWTVDFLTECRKGDDYAVVWSETRSADGRTWGREILAAIYDGKYTKRHAGVRFEDRYYDEKGNSLHRMFLRAPLNFRRISSYFSRRRFHPVLRYYRPHLGIDYAAPRGTPVVAVGKGRVSHVGRKGGLGKAVEFRHNATYKTLYGHLSRYAKGIKKGKQVKQGQVIGYVGSTGISTGPHLDFRISKNGKWVNFLRLKLPKIAVKPLPKKKKAAFAALRDRYLNPIQTKILTAKAKPEAGENGDEPTTPHKHQ